MSVRQRVMDTLNSPGAMVQVHGWSVVFWMVMIPVSYVTGLKDSVPFLNFISLWALVAAHWSGFQGAHAERENGKQ